MLFLLSLTINILIITVQFIVQSTRQEFYIGFGFPFQFFYFNEHHGLRGSNIRNFIYDELLTTVFAMILLLVNKKFNRNYFNKNRPNEIIDSE